MKFKKKKKRILSCCVATATEYLIKTKSIPETTPLGTRTVMMLHRMCPQSATEVPFHCYLWVGISIVYIGNIS